MIAKITKLYTRLYTDNGQRKAYVEWVDTQGHNGRTEGNSFHGAHMAALKARGEREGVKLQHETW